MANPPEISSGLRQSPRLGLLWRILPLVIIIAGWSIFWNYAANRAGEVVDGFVAREAARGRLWTCPERQVSGYPFRLEIRCDAPRFSSAGAGAPREASLGGLVLHGRVLEPGQFTAQMLPPFKLSLPNQGEIELSWQKAAARFTAGFEGVSEAALEIQSGIASFGWGDARDIQGLARQIAFNLRRSPGDKPGTDLALLINDLTLAPLDQWTGNPEPISLEIQATAPGLVIEPDRRIEAALETWRQGGGQARIVLAKANKGASQLDLSGVLGLDAQRRLEGNLQGRAKGLDALLSGLGRKGGFNLGGLLGNLTGGQGLPVAFVLENGRMRFGPFVIAELEPLY